MSLKLFTCSATSAALRTLPTKLVLEEPEFIITEMTFDTGATTHAADRLDFPEQEARESEGSKAGQSFGCAGGKKLVNEGAVNIVMLAPAASSASSRQRSRSRRSPGCCCQ